MPERPFIVYPCRWEYRVIGQDREALVAAIRTVVGDLDHVLADGNRSGKYLSLSLELVVADEDQRNALFVALKRQGAVIMVL
ncbi:MAG: DUF493 domain-containing protein [Planctomycetota bacterium]